MARILVIFGTTEGQTGKVAQALADRLRLDGHEAEVVNAAKGHPDADTYDAIVVAASLHAGRYQKDVVSWVRSCSSILNHKPTAFVSVCLGVLQHEPKVQRELGAILDRFLKSTGWRPLETFMTAGAIKYSKYNFIVRWLMKRMAGKAGGGTDTSRDYEYTDWAELRQFADRFSERLEAVSAPLSA